MFGRFTHEVAILKGGIQKRNGIVVRDRTLVYVVHKYLQAYGTLEEMARSFAGSAASGCAHR